MKRRNFIKISSGLSGMMALSPKVLAGKENMKIHFLRHATFILEVAGLKLLIDPMLSAKEAMDPIKISRNTFRIPMTDLPIDAGELKSIIASLDAVVVTHTHRDHWDARAQTLLDKNLPLICQPSDVETFQKQDFRNTLPVNTSIEFKGLKIYRTGGQHGTGDIGLKMGHVSGFVIEYKNEKIYIAGDTIWCAEVEDALSRHQPGHIVLNAGAAQFDSGGSITMDENDVLKVLKAAPSSKVIAVHMETVNHCLLTRNDLAKVLQGNYASARFAIPADGDELILDR